MDRFFTLSLRTAALVFLLGLSACASVDSADGSKNKDPLEGMNRKIFAFNDALDSAILKPTARGYQKVTPDLVQSGVSNFFSNVGEVSNVTNNILQWKWKRAGNDLGRFLLNSTIGLAGLVEVAAPAGLQKNDRETFGQTLTVWGLGTGPYIVLPFLGPSTGVDLLASPVEYELGLTPHLNTAELRVGLKTLEVVKTRASLLGTENMLSGDKYVFIREAFLQNRDYKVKDGKVVDDFGGEFEGFDEDF